MKNFTLQERADFYNKSFPDYPPLVTTDRWLYGVWVIGAYYRNKTSFYGAYPHSYLERITSMFPDAENTLHLFSGSLDASIEGKRFDINPELNPDIVGNAEELSSVIDEGFDLVLADPPYSGEDAKHYGTPMVNRNKVMRELYKILDDNGYIIWLDQVLPMFRKDEVELVGTIGLIRSTNHRFRVVSVFRSSLGKVSK